ncbi:Sec-independent protein translocase subunit TatA [Pseudonocardia saturnea]
MPSLGGWEFVILIGILVLLFGAKRLPDMARSIGQSARVFKGEMKGMKSDSAATDAAPAPADPPATTPAPAPLPPATAAAPATPPVQQQPTPATGQGHSTPPQ